jgi:hypothetical protein
MRQKLLPKFFEFLKGAIRGILFISGSRIRKKLVGHTIFNCEEEEQHFVEIVRELGRRVTVPASENLGLLVLVERFGPKGRK